MDERAALAGLDVLDVEHGPRLAAVFDDLADPPRHCFYRDARGVGTDSLGTAD